MVSATRSIYKVLRSLLFTAVLAVIGLVAIFYIVVSVPAVSNAVKVRAEMELSALLGGKIKIGSVNFYPFNEVCLNEVELISPQGERCISVGKLGAGLSLWSLVSSGTIEVTYAEIIALNAQINQPAENAPLNIDFLINALSKKDNNKPPAKFRVVLRNVVIRKSFVAFDRSFIPESNDGKFDFNHIAISNLRADVALPLLANDDFNVDLRRLAFMEKCGLNVNNLSLKAHVSPSELSFSDFNLRVGNSDLSISDQSLKIDGYKSIVDNLKSQVRRLVVNIDPLIPSDFAAFYPKLASLNNPFDLSIDVDGSAENLSLNALKFSDMDNNCYLSVVGNVNNISNPKNIDGNISSFELSASSDFIQNIISLFSKVDAKQASLLRSLGDIDVNSAGSFDFSSRSASAIVDLASGVGTVDAKSNFLWDNKLISFSDVAVKAKDVNVGAIINNPLFGLVSLEAEGNASIVNGDVNCDIIATLPKLVFNSNSFENIGITASKSGKELNGNVSIDNPVLALNADANCLLDKENSEWNLDAHLQNAFPAALGVAKFAPSDCFSGNVTLSAVGNSVDNLVGALSITDFVADSKKRISLNEVSVKSVMDDNGLRTYSIDSDFLKGDVFGNFKLSEIVIVAKNLAAQVAPDFVKPSESVVSEGMNANLKMRILPSDDLYSTLSLPFRPGVDATIDAEINGATGNAELFFNAPYLVKGKNKLIKNTTLSAKLSQSSPAVVSLATNFPMKNDRADINLSVSAIDGFADVVAKWVMQNNEDNCGNISLNAGLIKNQLTQQPEALVRFGKSDIMLNESLWSVSPAVISFADSVLSVNNLRIAHGSQFIDVNGKASADPLDMIKVELAGVDLEYIFDILNINHVNFGGIASGRALVSSLFSKSPMLRTDGLFVKDLAYNNCVLGDGNLESHWDVEDKMVAINADISGDEDAWAKVRGGIYVTRDSLSFDFNAKKINIAMLQPFMSGFTSSVKGRATGNIKLYGTFSDIDLGGKAFADTITMKVDYTNVYYSGSDTIFFSPGRIAIPSIRLYDKYGNSALMTGEVTHNFLHDACFNFNVSNARDMLVYDTSQKSTERWYGRVFASGNASLVGQPGSINLDINMSTSKNSVFNLVLDDSETASDYQFLTFSDRKKAAEESEVKEVSFEEKLKKESESLNFSRSDLFTLDMALDVSPDAKMVLVMDPNAGDKIEANGNGALQMHYASDSDDFSIYGKYTLTRGTYNFSLQDLILKNFKINEGSSISFNGDPLAGLLDISASYRVNSNLTDLDLSFRDDPDLNRTTVPVDALLKVTGDINSPEIKFDISLPTVTSEVDRKVRSIISTEDMMNRQVIYLLALNRFYTPEYMGANQGGELASVASSTISSQIQNIIGSITDKFSLAPSFKSEKSDLSDMEFDVALSSSLFDNRLLLNGNLGYRDKNTSQTTFVGDFDIEYLLSRDGKLRLKAYNHFNDASYYLKSALTTQGIGIVYRKDFNDPFAFLKRMFRRNDNKHEQKNSSKKKTSDK